MEYLLYFSLALILSILFSMGGTGSGIAMIPLLHLLGIEFNLAKAVGIFTGFTTTVTSSVMNFRRGVLEIRFAMPLALSLLVFAPLGAQLSRFVEMDWLLLGACAAGAILGGSIGNHLMHVRLSQAQVKRVIAVLLYLLAFRMLWMLWR